MNVREVRKPNKHFNSSPEFKNRFSFFPEPVSLLIFILLEEAAAHVQYKKARLPLE